MIYRFRMILDAEEDVFRDIELEQDNTFEDLHNAILQSFGIEGHEMATFYLSDEDWNQGEAIAQADLFDEPCRLMADTLLQDVFSEDQKNALYIYDFLNMWTFFVECMEEAESVAGASYPNLVFSHGHLPAEPPPKRFEESQDNNQEEESDDWDDEWNDDHSDQWY